MARRIPLGQHIRALLFILCIASAAPSQTVLNQASKDLTPILTFDDLPTSRSSGSANISHYSHLTLSSFTLVNASAAASTGLIHPRDANCAVSAPNALIASRHANPSLWPRIVLSPTAASAAQLSPFFNFVGFYRKPMNYTPLYTAVFINAYGIVNNTVLSHYSLVSTYLTEGYQPSFPLNITQFFPTWGKGVNMVEMYAQTPDGEDWDFCVDNLMLEFLPEGEGDKGHGWDVPHVRMHGEVEVKSHAVKGVRMEESAYRPS